MRRDHRRQALRQTKELKTCDNKTRYKTLAHAQAHAAKYLRVYGKRQYPYLCPWCGGHHLTTRKHHD